MQMQLRHSDKQQIDAPQVGEASFCLKCVPNKCRRVKLLEELSAFSRGYENKTTNVVDVNLSCTLSQILSSRPAQSASRVVQSRVAVTPDYSVSERVQNV